MNTEMFPSLAEVQRAKETPIAAKVVDNVAASAPFFNRLSFQVIQGTTYKHRRLMSIPKIGPRPLNSGVKPSVSRYEITNAECYPYQGIIAVDQMVADADARGKNAMMAEESNNVIGGAEVALEEGLIYGSQLGLENGMVGLVDIIGDYMTISADSSKNTEATKQAGGTSVWAIQLGPEAVHGIFGNNQGIRISQETLGYLDLNGDSKLMPSRIRNASTWIGLDNPKTFAVARLINVDEAHPVTDDLLLELVRLFPQNNGPTIFLMNSLAATTLRKNRTAELTFNNGDTKQQVLAGSPRSMDNIEIVVTDTIIDNETKANIKALGKETEVVLKSHKSAIKNI